MAVAKLDIASDSDSEGCGFDSRRSQIIWDRVHFDLRIILDPVLLFRFFFYFTELPQPSQCVDNGSSLQQSLKNEPVQTAM